MSPPNLPWFSWSVAPESIVVVPVKVPLRESPNVRVPVPVTLNVPVPEILLICWLALVALVVLNTTACPLLAT